MSELYNALKAEIERRHSDRLKECRDLNSTEKILRSQGAARELEQLLSVVEQMEHPQEPEKEGS